MKISRIIAGAMAVGMLTGCSTGKKSSFKEPEAPVHYDMPEITTVEEELHSSVWYPELCDSVSRFYNGGDVTEHIANREIKRALMGLRNDHPEFFWLGTSYSAITITDGARVEFSYNSAVKENEIPRMYIELQQTVDEIVHSIPDGSDYEKVLYVHDYIARHTRYDHIAAKKSNMGLACTSYGCLVNGLAVCEGYAEAFQLIMNKIGIESGIATGSNHAWNFVKLDGEYYWLDVTWDDMDFNRIGVCHTYFLMDDDQLLRTRSMDLNQAKMPVCSDPDNNYIIRNGGYFAEYDEKAVLAYIADSSDRETIELQFADYESYKKALTSLFVKNRIGKAGDSFRKSSGYYRWDEMLTITIPNPQGKKNES